MKRLKLKKEQGFALVAVLILTFALALIAAFTLRAANQDTKIMQGDVRLTQALYLAEAGANRIAEAMWLGYNFTDPRYRVEWLDAHSSDFDQFDVQVPGMDGSYTVQTLATYPGESANERIFVFESRGMVGGLDRTVTRVVQYGLGRSKVFDYVYFINNFGWFYGSTIRANGDVRANGNFDSQYNPKINGDVYAAVNPDNGAPGQVLGANLFDSLPTYRSNALDHFRPAWPDAAHGYDGNSDRFGFQQQLYMPYLNDISIYEDLARQKHGTITIDNTVVVNEVANGKTVLIGTTAKPIVINGPVVIKGDVAIKGVIDGQGTIYAERNVHVIGDITYKTRPKWPHNGSNIHAMDAHNKKADLLGLAARGSIILGDYTESSWSSVNNYIKPPFTHSYVDENGSTFNGDYTALNGKKEDNTNRRYYESTWNNTTFGNMASNNITRIDGILYTNHLLGGRTGDVDFNGTIISRDEAIIFSGNADMNYDYRIRDDGENYIDIDLPKAPRMTQLFWADKPFMDSAGNINPEFLSVIPGGL